jgi:hypothetical protein
VTDDALIAALAAEVEAVERLVAELAAALDRLLSERDVEVRTIDVEFGRAA